MSKNQTIKEIDNFELRSKIDVSYKDMTPVGQAKWSLSIAKSILNKVGLNYKEIVELEKGFSVNEQWQINKASIVDVRQASFTIHTLALKYDKEDQQMAIRVAGHAVATGYMSEHAMVASDYAIKVINILYPNDKEAVKNERIWQLNEIKTFQ